MNFRRSSFQFSALDPQKRQEELRKRFGLSSITDESKEDQKAMSPGMREPLSISRNPRMQHRVPIFDSKQKNIDNGYNPRVRVVPIQVEGVDGNKPSRVNTKSNGVEDVKKETHQENILNENPAVDSSEPKVCHIPVKVESNKERLVEVNSVQAESAKKLKVDSNDSAASANNFQELYKINSLKQIESVLNKLELYKTEVERFSGTVKDKQYRYLDEMLTRCMLDLDNVETLGLDEIRQARKNAVKRIQYCIDLLDSKVHESAEKVGSIINNPAELQTEEETCNKPNNSATEEPKKELLDSNIQNSDKTNEDCDVVDENKKCVEENSSNSSDKLTREISKELIPELAVQNQFSAQNLNTSKNSITAMSSTEPLEINFSNSESVDIDSHIAENQSNENGKRNSTVGCENSSGAEPVNNEKLLVEQFSDQGDCKVYNTTKNCTSTMSNSVIDDSMEISN